MTIPINAIDVVKFMWTSLLFSLIQKRNQIQCMNMYKGNLHIVCFYFCLVIQGLKSKIINSRISYGVAFGNIVSDFLPLQNQSVFVDDIC